MYRFGERELRVLAVIPARGGSKGIRKKNIRFVAGKPLIYYPIVAAQQSKYVDSVYVTSDDEIILRIAKLFGAAIIKRPPELATDDVTLDPVVYHAVNEAENNSATRYDIVITLQPTTPLITAQDIDNAIEMLIKENYDTIIFALDATHLYWINTSGEWRPLLSKRVNRQYLPKIARELGVVITWRKYVRKDSRFGPRIGLYLVSQDKGVDIDTPTDLMIAEALLQRYNILFIVDGRRETGLGHIYRCLTLAERFHGHRIIFLTNGRLGVELIGKMGYTVNMINDLDEVVKYLSTMKFDIVVNDILDTSESYMKLLRENTSAVIVNFEDLGEGAKYADLVFNALYEFSSPPPKHYYGYKYFILRDEFRLFPIKEYDSNVRLRTLTIIFGGVDQNNLTMKTLRALEKLNFKNININVIVGPGYIYLDVLREYVNEMLKKGYRIELYSSPSFIADIIRSSELVVTSNGRTLYEVISYAIPAISIAQNERELRHPLVYVNKGIKFLGLANRIDEDDIANAIEQFVLKPELLVKANRILIPYAKDIRRGIKRVLRIILDEVIERGED